MLVDPTASGSEAEPIALRVVQEQSVAVTHALTEAEFALAREACAVGRTFAAAGIPFDPVTFVVTRILESSVDEAVDPIDCLRVVGELGLLDRSARLTLELLDDAA